MLIDRPLQTPRLTLRSLTGRDCSGGYLAWMNDPLVQRYLESRNQTNDLSSIVTFVERCNASPDVLLLGIIEQATESHIGNIKLGSIDRHHSRSAIGILLGEKSAWGKGYACEAIGAVSRFAFEALGLAKLFAGAYAENESSIKAFCNAGFSVEARLHQHAVIEDRRTDVLMLAKMQSRSSQ